MEVRVPHALPREQAAAQLVTAAEAHGLGLESEGPLAGRLEKTTPLGAVRGRYRVEAAEVVVVVDERPPFLPEGVVRRAVEDALGRALAPA